MPNRRSNSSSMERSEAVEPLLTAGLLRTITIVVCATLACATLVCLAIAFAEHGDRVLTLIVTIFDRITSLVHSIFEIVFIKVLGEIVIIQGFGGAVTAVMNSGKAAISRVYSDFSVEKVILFVAVAVIVKQFPWVMDRIVSMLVKPPKT